jgi:hypothetical protein
VCWRALSRAFIHPDAQKHNCRESLLLGHRRHAHLVGLRDLHAASLHTEVTAILANGTTIYGFRGAPDVNEDACIWTEDQGIHKLQDVSAGEFGLGSAIAGWRIWRVNDVTDNGLVLVRDGETLKAI